MTTIVVNGQRLLNLSRGHPWVVNHFRYRNSIVDVAVEHFANKIDAVLGEWQKGDSKGVIENLVDVVEWILLVNDSIEQNAQSPHILFLSAVGFALEDFRCRVIYNN